MKNNVIEFEQSEVMINGKVYPILMSDVDIIESVLDIQNKYDSLDISDPKAVCEAIVYVSEWANKALGEHALEKISNGRPVNLLQAMQIVTAVNEAVAESYTERVVAEYGVQPVEE